MVRAILGLAGLLAALAAQAAPVITRVDTPGEVGLYTSLQLNGGNPVVSYYDRTGGALKLATCVADCASAAPSWIIATVDDTGDVGWYSSLQLDGGKPIVAYYDVTNGALKLATCTAGCATAAPTWIITTIDARSVDTGRFPSLQLDGAGKPIISYRDRTNRDLMLATCTGGCATPAPTWILATVDAPGDVGAFTTMQLDAGKPVIAYFDFGGGNVKLATCVADCATATPAWAITIVDTVPGDAESQFSLALNAGKPVIAYYDTAHGELKLATCTAGCSSATPTWAITVVDSHGDAGSYSSLQLVSGNPVVAYLAVLHNCTAGTAIACHTAMDLRLATCTANCSSASPTWVVTTVDNSGLAGYDPSLKVAGGGAFVSYEDYLARDLKVAAIDLAAAAIPSNYTALWWNFDESGWGINFTHQGNIVFGTLFTYDAAGNPMWLVMSKGIEQSPGVFSGPLYRTTGPPFDANPFTPIGPSNVTPVGTMTVEFAGDSASLVYTVNGRTVAKTIRKQVFGARPAQCRATDASRGPLTNYQDLWWNPDESGWGINITHQGDILFATLFTYAASGQGLWLVMPDGRRQPDGSYLGDLFTTTGPAFDATPFPPIGPGNVTKVGTLQLRFASGTGATLSYTFNGTTVVKSITRQVFASPAPACS